MTRLDDQDEDVFVEIMDFGKDTSAREMVTVNADGSYTVFINARIAYAQQQDAIQHALRHITNDDFSRADVQQIEAEAHQIVDKKAKKEVDKAKLKRQKLIRDIKRERKVIQKQLEEYERLIETRLQYEESYYQDHYLF